MKHAKFTIIILGILIILMGSVIAAEKKEFVAPIGSDGIQRVEILGGSYFFDPNFIVVKVNVPVKMTFRKESGMTPHNIVLSAPEAGININMELTTEPQTVRFTPTRTGVFTFYCSKKLLFFDSHQDKGMVGTLEVRH